MAPGLEGERQLHRRGAAASDAKTGPRLELIAPVQKRLQRLDRQPRC